MAPSNAELLADKSIPQVWYFDFGGRAEAIRRAFLAAGVEFLDVRMKPPAFGARKAKGEFLFGSVPVLKMGDDQIAESMALANAGLKMCAQCPRNAEARMVADAHCAAMNDLIMSLVPGAANFANDEEKSAFRNKMLTEVWPKALKATEEQIEKNGKNGHVVGDTFTVADFAVNGLVGMCKMGGLDFIAKDALDGYPNLLAVCQAVEESDLAKKWNDFYAKAKESAVEEDGVTVIHVPGDKKLTGAEFVNDSEKPAGKPTLTYFHLTGRGEPSRLAFTAAGVEFEDERLAFEQFGAAKAAGKYVMGLPELTVNGTMYRNSTAIGRYAASFDPNFPKDIITQSRIEQVVLAVEGMLQQTSTGQLGLTPEALKAWREGVGEGKWKPFLVAFEKMAQDSKTDFLFDQATPSIADCTLAVFLEFMPCGFLDHIPKDIFAKYEALAKLRAAVEAHAPIAAYRKKVADAKAEAEAAAAAKA